MRRAADLAAAAGDLDRNQHSALTYVLDAGDRWCHDVELRLATIGQRVGGYASRTAGRWMRELKELGWIECVHRWDRTDDGGYKGRSNQWRGVIPERFRAVVEGQEDGARARAMTARKGRVTPKAPRSRPGSGTRPGARWQRDGGPVRVGEAAAALVTGTDEISGRGGPQTEPQAPAPADAGELVDELACGCGQGVFSHPCGLRQYQSVCPRHHVRLCSQCKRSQAPP